MTETFQLESQNSSTSHLNSSSARALPACIVLFAACVCVAGALFEIGSHFLTHTRRRRHPLLQWTLLPLWLDILDFILFIHRIQLLRMLRDPDSIIKPAMTVSIHLRGVATGDGGQAGLGLGSQAGQVLAHLLSVAHMRRRARKRRGSRREIRIRDMTWADQILDCTL